MIRILHVITGMGSGGAEMMIMNWYRNIDRTKVQFDFLLRSSENIYSAEIEKLGGRVYYTSEYPKHYWKNRAETKEFFKSHASEYHAIHVHCNALLYVNVLNIAKRYGVKVRIIHSHNTQARNKLFGFVHKLNKNRVDRMATHFFACSSDAGKWAFYPKRKFTVIKNGVDTAKYKFDQESRCILRRQLGIEDKFVVGNVARFLPSKNHPFLIECFEKLQRHIPNAVLLLIGSGKIEHEIRQLVANKGLQNSVKFLGVRKDVNSLYSAMDCFWFPSYFEGLGLVLVEAQSSGLRCLVSDCIPKEVKVCDLIEFLPIDDVELWVQCTLNLRNIEREKYYHSVMASGFDIKLSAMQLQEIYLEGKSTN